jgi:hypothetical protein
MQEIQDVFAQPIYQYSWQLVFFVEMDIVALAALFLTIGYLSGGTWSSLIVVWPFWVDALGVIIFLELFVFVVHGCQLWQLRTDASRLETRSSKAVQRISTLILTISFILFYLGTLYSLLAPIIGTPWLVSALL